MKVIVVDDERLLLEQFEYESAGVHEIEVLGYFDSPLDALNFAKTHIKDIDIAFVDIGMPEMDGFELAAALRALKRDMRLVVITSVTAVLEEQHGIRFDGILLKPYSGSELEQVIGRVKQTSGSPAE